MNKIFFFFLIFFTAFFDVYAQQDPHYTQYMYNMNVINPAYAGSKENISLGLLYRKQWINIDGAPETLTFAAHSPIGKNVGLGLSVISDKIGPIQEQNVFGDFSYTIKFNETHKLALGLKAGAAFHNVGLRDIQSSLPDPSEGVFGQDINDVSLNLGAGAFYYSEQFYFALSVPNMITTGYVFNLNEKLKFKPSTMLKSAFNVRPSLDASANFLFNEKFEIGATYRLEDSFGAMVNFAITPELRIGYAYDHVVSNLNLGTPSSHEFMLLYDIFVSKKVSRSPRFF